MTAGMRRPALLPLAPLALLAACAVPEAAPSGAAAELCGRRFASVPDLKQQLERDGAYRESPGPETERAQPLRWFDLRREGLTEEWLVTPAGHPMSPAASCSRRERTAAGRWPRHRATFCAAATEQCAAFEAFLARRDLMPNLVR